MEAKSAVVWLRIFKSVENTQFMKKNTEALLVSSFEFGLEVNTK
jgi:hypothetical protein